MNTFIADSNGDKAGYFEGRASLSGLPAELTAKYCTCDETTETTSQIPDWGTAKQLGNLPALKVDMTAKIQACDATTKAAMLAMLKAIKSVIQDLDD